ncbi:hypothetical protein ACFTSF_33420 [Kribbella sp. NPDC056951]|uniref:hypothetical protein n=1 Tax=Kribbella sp. NPDC056951 TaxID=3345978 RepID=UPI00363B07ED
MTAQNNTFQNDECRDQADQAAAETDPLGPIAMPTRLRIGARALALSGVVGLSAIAVALGTCDPSTFPTSTISNQ